MIINIDLDSFLDFFKNFKERIISYFAGYTNPVFLFYYVSEGLRIILLCLEIKHAKNGLTLDKHDLAAAHHSTYHSFHSSRSRFR